MRHLLLDLDPYGGTDPLGMLPLFLNRTADVMAPVLVKCLLLSGESNIANLWKDHFSAIANSVGSTDNKDQVMNALGTVPGHNDVINAHELRQIVRGLKSKKVVGNDGISSEVYKFASERLLTIMSIFFSGCMLSGKLSSTLMHVVIIPLLRDGQ